MMLLGERYYDPAAGRFLSADPDQDGLNWYVYADNDPANSIDPYGTKARPVNDKEWEAIKETIEAILKGMKGDMKAKVDKHCFDLHKKHLEWALKHRGAFKYDPDYDEYANTRWGIAGVKWQITFGNATDFSDKKELMDTIIHEFIHVSEGGYSYREEKCELKFDEAAEKIMEKVCEQLKKTHPKLYKEYCP